MIEVLAARAAWCRPDERILWCTPLRKASGSKRLVLYSVRGLDETGERSGLGSRAFGAVGGFLADAAGEVLSPGDEGSTSFDGPFARVTGAGSDCLAVSRLAAWQPTNSNTGDRNLLWFLTTHRFALIEFEVTKANGPGALGGLRRTVGRFFGDDGAEAASSAAAEAELPRLKVQAEVPRSEIRSLDIVEHKATSSSRRLPFLRITLLDGSTIDVSDDHDDKRVRRMLAMSHGQE
ncbi:hypothetical protein GCM10011581_49220 [Saccharopolyspora subtropica]|uniref:Uncharacterized protein n=1 Tax=Saccharopolyspora thermophila TaxID=89367 RepID=A0A917KCY1_9PSEU|nr:hypothetical protein [Saccharopolyspora subtropica]GGJ06447.1 hypothetical protein GCM10011581_49220 [Saccharopolyspora subtropica]